MNFILIAEVVTNLEKSKNLAGPLALMIVFMLVLMCFTRGDYD